MTKKDPPSAPAIAATGVDEPETLLVVSTRRNRNALQPCSASWARVVFDWATFRARDRVKVRSEIKQASYHWFSSASPSFCVALILQIQLISASPHRFFDDSLPIGIDPSFVAVSHSIPVTWVVIGECVRQDHRRTRRQDVGETKPVVH